MRRRPRSRRRWRGPAPAPRSDPAGSSPASRPSRITRMRSDMPMTSGSSLETIRIGDAVGGQLAHQLVDRVLGADVDAARGLVHQHHARLDAQPAREHDLLLVAAGEELHLLVERRGPRPRGSTARRAARGARRRRGRQHGADHAERVVEDGLVERQALGLAVLGDQREPAADALARAAHGDGLVVERHVPRSNGCTPNTASTSSVRPEPCSPARPTISPARTARSTPSTYGLPAPCSVSRTSPTSVPGSLSGKYDVSGRPTICRTSEASVSSLAGPLLTWRPSLRM